MDASVEQNAAKGTPDQIIAIRYPSCSLPVQCGGLWVWSLQNVSYRAPPKITRKLNRLFQYLTAAPIYAFPNELLFQLRSCGLGGNIDHATCTSRASMYRVAAVADIDNTYPSIALDFSPDNHYRFLAHPMREWVLRSLTHGIWTNKRRVDAFPDAVALFGVKKSQSKLAAIIWPSLNVRSAGHGLLRRVRYFDPMVPNDYAAYMEGLLRGLAGLLPFGTIISGIRLICNGLNTSRRYRNRRHDGDVLCCPWCGCENGDEIWHILSCPVIIEVLRNKWPLLHLADNRIDAMTRFCYCDRPDKMEAAKRTLIADLIVKCYHSRLQGNTPIQLLLSNCIQARLSHWLLSNGNTYNATWRSLNA